MKITRLAVTAYAFAAVIILVDQLTKLWVLDGLDIAERGVIPVLPFFRLSLVHNDGVSFGLFGGGSARWVLTVFSLAVAGLLAWWANRTDRRLMTAAIGLVMGGALGNVIDRIRFGHVIDFLDFSQTGVFPWVFNVADSAITVGVILLVLDSLRSEQAAKVGAAPEKS
ncbi:MAG: signal peptidase II [Brevundimonas sp.]|uniref:signal peptidase II n=1 Tax=Brevundimonas sp. TaxID=1871086 RepID=UPI0025BDB431|nr:signal peptidase II [Brevundimonas sp.]MBX3477783.1 signal peptidase II [Brevundimonas sp.]